MTSRAAPSRLLVAPLVLLAAVVGLTLWPAGRGQATSTTSTTTAGETTTTLSGTTTVPTTTTSLPLKRKLWWPVHASAAIAAPAFAVLASSANQPRVPIASLTKMMTAWIVLHTFPLRPGQRGPCVIVGARDMAEYRHEVAIGESNVVIEPGLRLCEATLLRGLFVHSAGDYAELLVKLVGAPNDVFVTEMNWYAKTLGMSQTHYSDFTGISPGDRSTAQDQLTLAVDLMTEEPVIPGIVALSHVALPVAGVVGSYTPFIGRDGVVGVKSGFTYPAGGCDVMAIDVSWRRNAYVIYTVVLGEHGDDPLGLAGQAALNLSLSLRNLLLRVAPIPTTTTTTLPVTTTTLSTTTTS